MAEQTKVVVPVDLLRRLWATHRVYCLFARRDELRELLKERCAAAPDRQASYDQAIERAARDLRVEAGESAAAVRLVRRAQGKPMPTLDRFPDHRDGWVRPVGSREILPTCKVCGSVWRADDHWKTHPHPIGVGYASRIELCAAKPKALRLPVSDLKSREMRLPPIGPTGSQADRLALLDDRPTDALRDGVGLGADQVQLRDLGVADPQLTGARLEEARLPPARGAHDDEGVHDDGEAYAMASGLWTERSMKPGGAGHLHRFCSCPPGYCSRRCIECLAYQTELEGLA